MKPSAQFRSPPGTSGIGGSTGRRAHSAEGHRRKPRHASRRPARLWWLVSARAGIALTAAAVLSLTWLITSPAGAGNSISYVQGAAATTGSPGTSQTLTFTQAVGPGDLLVGWFAQYNAAGQVHVSDNVNGAWTRGPSETFTSGTGDIALFFMPNSAAAPQGLTITVTSSASTYLQSSAAEYSGVSTVNPLDQSAVNEGNGTSVSTGLTTAVPAGEMVYSALTTGGSPGSVTPGSSQGATYTARATSSGGVVYEQDILSATAGAQQGTATLGTATDWYAVVATFTPASGSSGGGTGGSATFQQGAAFSSGTLSTTSTLTLSRNVHAGDLLVGWFAQFNVPGQVTVSDNINGAWTRAPNSLTFQSDTGDIALYYLADSKASASGLTITVSAPTPAYLQGTAAEYSGLAVAGPLDQISSGRGVGAAVNTGNTAAVASGDLVYSAILTGSTPGSVTPGQSGGTTYTLRAETASGSSYEQDILSATAGAQVGTATLGTSADWYAVAAAFRLYPNDTSPPGAPSALTSLSAASSRVALSWSPGSGDLTGYAVTRNGQVIGTTASNQTTYLDTTVAGGASYTYSVDAFDGAGLSSSPTNSVVVTTPASSPQFIQGTAASPGSRLPSLTLTLSQPVAAGDFLVGWFGQYNAPGQVQVSDNVNGVWTRGPSETFGGTGDIALEYVANAKAAPQGLTITVSASAPAYLQEAIAEFRGVSTVNPLVASVVGSGSSAAVSMGPTASVPSGDLLVGATITAGQPGSVVAGSSQGVPFVTDVQNGSASANLEDILATAAGPQTAAETLGSASTSYTIVAAFATAAAPSAPTSVTVTGPSSVAVGSAYSASASAAGANPGATYSLAGAPSWLSVDPNAGTVTGNVPTGITSFSYAVIASNSQGSATSAIQTVTVTPGTPGTTSLALSPNPAPPVAAGIPLSYTATVTETSGSGALAGSVTFTANGASVPGCTNLAVTGGSATCTTSFAATGTYTLAASYGADPNFTGSSASVSQVVTALPQFTSPGTATATVGTPFTFTVTTTGYPSPSLTETGTLPTGLSFTANPNGTATISGTPAARTGGSSTITVQAANSAGSTAQSFVLVVDQAPAITSAATATATVGKAMSFTVTTTGYPNASLTETGALPTGLSFTAKANGTATISGTPAAGTGGTYTVNLQAANAAGSAAQGFVLVVNNAVPTVSAVSPNTGSKSGGTAITITGTGFVTGATVKIGQGGGAGGKSIAATNVKVVSPTQITAVTGGGAKAGTWNLFVTTSGGTSAANSGDYFTYH